MAYGWDVDHAAIAAAVLACPICHASLEVDGMSLVCPNEHAYTVGSAFVDMWPADQEEPALDFFGTPYGLVYDSGVKERWLARLVGRVLWGADVDRMYRLMDDGIRCDEGEVLLDVPAGGAPALRSAPGRMRGTYVGIDLSAQMLRRAAAERDDSGIEAIVLARGDATRLPVPGESVDRILCFNGLHVFPDKQAVMQEFSRVLKPGGEIWGNCVAVDQAQLGRILRPWTTGAAGGRLFHPADPADLELTAIENGFEWEQEMEGAMLFFRGLIPD